MMCLFSTLPMMSVPALVHRCIAVVAFVQLWAALGLRPSANRQTEFKYHVYDVLELSFTHKYDRLKNDSYRRKPL